MISKPYLGLFWGQDTFCFVETKMGQPAKTAYIPFNTPIDTDQNQDVPEGLRFTVLIQKAMQQQGMTSKKINLALPAKDLMFRSFVVPWMSPDEVPNVVEFEVTKYIPIPLANLVYTYHPVNFTENNQKKLRILFVAIRKKVLEKYTGILEHTNLQVEHIEPSAVSLIRVLQKQRHISGNHSNAIIEIRPGGGKVIITDQAVVQFVREFQVPADQDDKADLTARLFNDIRVSLDFYIRQTQQKKIDSISILSLSPFEELQKDLSSEFKIPVKSIPAANVLKTDQVADIGLLSAYGIAIRDKAFSSKNFDLSEKSRKLQNAGGADAEAVNYRMMAGVVAACALIIFLTAFLTDKMVSGLQKQRVELQAKQGIFEGSETSQVEKMKTDLSDKLSSYKEVRIKSSISFYLRKIPQLLPQGTWLNNLDITYNDSPSKKGRGAKKVSPLAVTLDGYVYLENLNNQFRVVNSLVARFKEEEHFSSSFADIDLVIMRQENLKNYPVTYFKIVCK